MLAIPNITIGSKIEVLEMDKTLIGKGTYIETGFNIGLKQTHYYCEEGVIIAEGKHLLSIDGGKYLKVSEPKTGQESGKIK